MIYKHNSGFNQPTMWIRKIWTWRDVLAAGLKPHLQFCSSSDLSRRVFFAPDIARLCPSSAYLKQSSSKQKWWCCARLAVAPGWLWGRRSALLWISETRAKNSRLSSSPRLFLEETAERGELLNNHGNDWNFCSIHHHEHGTGKQLQNAAEGGWLGETMESV